MRIPNNHHSLIRHVSFHLSALSASLETSANFPLHTRLRRSRSASHSPRWCVLERAWWGGTVAWQPDLNVSHEMAARFGGTQVIGSKPRRQITSVDTSERPERSPTAARWGSAPPALFLHLPRLWFRVLTHRAVPPPQHRPRQPGPPTELSSAQASEVRRFRQEDHVAPLLRQMIYLISVLSPGRPQVLKSGLTGSGAV